MQLHNSGSREYPCKVYMGQRSTKENREVKGGRKTNAKEHGWGNTSCKSLWSLVMLILVLWNGFLKIDLCGWLKWPKMSNVN